MSPFPRWGHAWNSERQLMLKGLLVALSAWFMSPSSVHAQTVTASRIVVRSYNTIGLPVPILDRAKSTIGDLLHRAGIDSTWRNCRTTAGPSSQSPDLCSDVPTASELIVRIVATPRAITDVEVLGYSHGGQEQRDHTRPRVVAAGVQRAVASVPLN